ncbi:cohesin domain-containing protein [Aureliella helgolandensis]|uniref:Cohesin domain-containing protein n=1 Tax=Aureliella helgolandensis TaxID=2527968 RepID=A0A518G3I7_9BACT|nr:cohesin domain-containing protein [Aureliella helgolandensis]QDV23130.1 hypothetical protein Q31a_14260 [Aureliella helgolandensis]
MGKLSRRLSLESLEARKLFAGLVGTESAGFCGPVRPPASEEIRLSVETSRTEGVRAAELQFEFDPSKFQLAPSDVTPGEAWQGKATLLTNIDHQAGLVSVLVYSSVAIQSDATDLVHLDLDLVDELAADVAADFVLKNLELNEGMVESPAELVLSEPRLPSPADFSKPTHAALPTPELSRRPIHRLDAVLPSSDRDQGMLYGPLRPELIDYANVSNGSHHRTAVASLT